MTRSRPPKAGHTARPAGDDGGAAMLRAMPSVDECLRACESAGGMTGLRREYIRMIVRREQAATRAAILSRSRTSGSSNDAREQLLEEVLRRTRAAIEADQPVLRPVINATGIVLHTNLGRALLAESAIEAMALAAGSAVNLEYNLETGGRGERDALVEEALCALTGAEAATVVNNNAGAVLLALKSLAAGREVVVSRGELVEIGGSFRLPDLMEHSGARLREVGTTNRTHPGDYEAAIGPETALLLKVHPSNYRVVGFTAAVSLPELVEIGRRRGVHVAEDLGSGALADLSQFGLPREPLVNERVAAGASLVTFSGDKLLGGPQSGIAVGRRDLIETMRLNPLRRALRCDKLTLAALEATLRLYLRSGDLSTALPTLRFISRTTGELEMIAERARAILAERLTAEFRIEVVPSMSQIGSGAQPAEEIPSRAIRITHPELAPEAVAAMFRGARPPIIGRIADDAFLLDMRAVDDASAFAVSFPPIRRSG